MAAAVFAGTKVKFFFYFYILSIVFFYLILVGTDITLRLISKETLNVVVNYVLCKACSRSFKRHFIIYTMEVYRVT